MAIIKTIAIHNRYGINAVSDYIRDAKNNGEKLDLSKADIDGLEPNSGLQAVLEYDMNRKKTWSKSEQRLLVDGYHCDAEHAAQDFRKDEKKWHENHKDRSYKDGRKPITAIHIVQSFPEGDFDPRLIHQIGMELLERLPELGSGQIVFLCFLSCVSKPRSSKNR